MKLAIVLLAACSGTTPAAIDAVSAGSDARSIDAPVTAFALTSPSLTAGGTFMTANTCDGANDSPAFAWTGAPATAKSFALVLTDTTIALTHAVIYDIPATATALPAALAKVYAPPTPAGTHQASSISNTPGYSGPCPPQGGAAHLYDFALYALDVATLPGTDMTSTRAQLTPLITQHMVAKATLDSNYAR